MFSPMDDFFLCRVASEIGRRQVLLENMKKLLVSMILTLHVTISHLTIVSSNQTSGAIKESSAAPANSIKSGGRLSVDSSRGSATSNPMASEQALLQRQRDVMKMQDNMLLDIETGVGRLHEKVFIHCLCV